MFTAALFTTAKIWKPPKCPLTDKWIKKIPYVYIWAVLWALTMLLPKKMPTAAKAVVYPLVCALHGFAYGTLYAPAQALMFGFNFEQTLAWILSGIPFDIIHGISNFAAGLMILPLVNLLAKLNQQLHRSRTTT